jgi:hypothetical protein
VSTPAWRKKLEQTARFDAPLCKSIRKGLEYTESLELILQGFVDCHDEMGSEAVLTRRVKRLLEKGGGSDHGHQDGDDRCGR